MHFFKVHCLESRILSYGQTNSGIHSDTAVSLSCIAHAVFSEAVETTAGLAASKGNKFPGSIAAPPRSQNHGSFVAGSACGSHQFFTTWQLIRKVKKSKQK